MKIIEILHMMDLFTDHNSFRDVLCLLCIVATLISLIITVIGSIINFKRARMLKADPLNERLQIHVKIGSAFLSAIVFAIFAILIAVTIGNWKDAHRELDIVDQYIAEGNYITAYNLCYSLYEEHANAYGIYPKLKSIKTPYKYQLGTFYEDAGLYEDALLLFEAIMEYEDSLDHIVYCKKMLNGGEKDGR